MFCQVWRGKGRIKRRLAGRSGTEEEPFMRKSMLAGLLCAIGLVTAAPVEVQTWCLRQTGSQSQVCAFPSVQDCTRAATYGGGICEREAIGPRPKADKRRPDGKSTRQKTQQDWW